MAFFQRTNWKDDGEFLIRVASLLEKGFSLDATISYLSITSPKYCKRYERIITSLANGNSFSYALQKTDFLTLFVHNSITLLVTVTFCKQFTKPASI